MAIKNYKVKYGQTIFDVALQLYGDVAGISDLLSQNPKLNLGSELSLNQTLQYDSDNVVNSTIVSYFNSNGIIVSNGAGNVYVKETDEDLRVLLFVDRDMMRFDFQIAGSGTIVIDWGDNTELESFTLKEEVQVLSHNMDSVLASDKMYRKVRFYGEVALNVFKASNSDIHKVFATDSFGINTVDLSNNPDIDHLGFFDVVNSAETVHIDNIKVGSLQPLIHQESMRDLWMTDSNLNQETLDEYFIGLVNNYENRPPCDVRMWGNSSPSGVYQRPEILFDPQTGLEAMWVLENERGWSIQEIITPPREHDIVRRFTSRDGGILVDGIAGTNAHLLLPTSKFESSKESHLVTNINASTINEIDFKMMLDKNIGRNFDSREGDTIKDSVAGRNATLLAPVSKFTTSSRMTYSVSDNDYEFVDIRFNVIVDSYEDWRYILDTGVAGSLANGVQVLLSTNQRLCIQFKNGSSTKVIIKNLSDDIGKKMAFSININKNTGAYLIKINDEIYKGVTAIIPEKFFTTAIYLGSYSATSEMSANFKIWGVEIETNNQFIKIPLPHMGTAFDINGEPSFATTKDIDQDYVKGGSKWLIEKGVTYERETYRKDAISVITNLYDRIKVEGGVMKIGFFGPSTAIPYITSYFTQAIDSGDFASKGRIITRVKVIKHTGNIVLRLNGITGSYNYPFLKDSDYYYYKTPITTDGYPHLAFLAEGTTGEIWIDEIVSYWETIAPNKEDGTPAITPTGEFSEVIDGSTFLNKTPFKVDFSVDEIDNSDLLAISYFDKSNTTYWDDHVRSGDDFDPSNPFMWGSNQLKMGYINLHANDGYNYPIWSMLGEGSDPNIIGTLVGAKDNVNGTSFGIHVTEGGRIKFSHGSASIITEKSLHDNLDHQIIIDATDGTGMTCRIDGKVIGKLTAPAGDTDSFISVGCYRDSDDLKINYADALMWDMSMQNNTYMLPLPHLGYDVKLGIKHTINNIKEHLLQPEIMGVVNGGGSEYMLLHGAVARRPNLLVGGFSEKIGVSGTYVSWFEEFNAVELQNKRVVLSGVIKVDEEAKENGVKSRLFLYAYRSDGSLIGTSSIARFETSDTIYSAFKSEGLVPAETNTLKVVLYHNPPSGLGNVYAKEISVTEVEPEWIPNTPDKEPLLPLLSGDVESGGSDFLNQTPFSVSFNGGDSDLKEYLWDKSRADIWNNEVRLSTCYSSDDTRNWCMSELAQRFIVDNINENFKYIPWVKIDGGLIKDIFQYSTPLEGDDRQRCNRYVHLNT